jgi:hypothetical protein
MNRQARGEGSDVPERPTSAMSDLRHHAHSQATSDRTQRVLLVQSAYYVATGVFPFISRRGFEAVTGPKREWWLVQTVGAIVLVIGGTIASAVRHDRVTPETLSLAAGSAVSLAAIDVVHVARRRIAPTYLLDAAVQVGFLLAPRVSRRRAGG